MTTGTLTPDQQAAAAAAKVVADAAAARAAAAVVPGQPVTTPAASTAVVPEGYVEVARFNGLMQRNEALSAQLTEANSNLATRSSSLEQSAKQIADMEAGTKVQVDENALANTKLNEQIAALTAKGVKADSLELKLKVATEMGRPELMALALHIPDSPDEGVIKEAFTAFAGFSDGAIKKREEQLLSGISPTSAAVVSTPAAPTTPQGWADHVNTFKLGSPEREKALKAYEKAVQAQT